MFQGLGFLALRILNFRDAFGVQIVMYTFKHILHSIYIFFQKLCDMVWGCSYAPLKEYYAPEQTKEPRRK